MPCCNRPIAAAVAVALVAWASWFAFTLFRAPLPLPALALRGQVVVVCGASTGIGRELALQAAGTGATVIAVARSEPKLQALADEAVSSSFKGRIVAFPSDLSQASSCQQLITKVLSQFGAIDMLVLNHIRPFFGSVVNTSIADIDAVLQVNLHSYLYLTKAVLPHMLEPAGRQKRLVAVSSFAGKAGVPFVAPYAASKHALHGFFDSLRLELDLAHPGHTLSITTCVIGNIDTDSAKQVTRGHLRDLPRHPAAQAAQAILHGAVHHADTLYYPAHETWLPIWLRNFMPGLIDIAIKDTMGPPDQQ